MVNIKLWGKISSSKYPFSKKPSQILYSKILNINTIKQFQSPREEWDRFYTIKNKIKPYFLIIVMKKLII
jgi:hypothetical protein